MPRTVNLEGLGLKRQEGETQEEYRVRRRQEQADLKLYLKGLVVWDSAQGAYVRPENRGIPLTNSDIERLKDEAKK